MQSKAFLVAFLALALFGSSTEAANSPVPGPYQELVMNECRANHSAPAIKCDPGYVATAQKCADWYQLSGYVKADYTDEKSPDDFCPYLTGGQIDIIGLATAGPTGFFATIARWIAQAEKFNFAKPDPATFAASQQFMQMAWIPDKMFGCAQSAKEVRAAAAAASGSRRLSKREDAAATTPPQFCTVCIFDTAVNTLRPSTIPTNLKAAKTP